MDDSSSYTSEKPLPPLRSNSRSSSSATVVHHHHDIEQGRGASSPAPSLRKGNGDDNNYALCVTWSGPDDPQHPQNWPLFIKLWISLLLTLITLNVSIGSSIFSAGSKEVEAEFGVQAEVATLGTSLYLLGFVFGPPFWGPISERFGRKVPMLSGLAGCAIWSIMAALGRDVATVIVARFLTGVFGASPASIIGGAAADYWGPVGRGINITIVVGVTFSGPLLGPVIGNFVVQSGASWRWNMWIMVIFAGVVCLVCLVAMPEAYPPMALKRKARRLRKESVDPRIKCQFDDESISIKYIAKVYLVRPWVLFFTEPILVFVSLFQAFLYGTLYLFLSSYPIEFSEERGWSQALGGLPLLSLALGISIAVVAVVVFSRTVFARKVAAHRGVVMPEDRLPPMIVGSLVTPIGLFWFAWTAAPAVPWPSVVCAGVLVGTGMFLVFITCITYLIDVYLAVCNSAMTSSSMMRALFGFAFPLFAPTMFHRLGTPWATSVLGFVSLAMIPVPVVLYSYGPTIRSWSKNTIKGTGVSNMSS